MPRLRPRTYARGPACAAAATSANSAASFRSGSASLSSEGWLAALPPLPGPVARSFKICVQPETNCAARTHGTKVQVHAQHTGARPAENAMRSTDLQRPAVHLLLECLVLLLYPCCRRQGRRRPVGCYAGVAAAVGRLQHAAAAALPPASGNAAATGAAANADFRVCCHRCSAAGHWSRCRLRQHRARFLAARSGPA